MIKPRIATLGLSVRQVRRLRESLPGADFVTASPALWEPTGKVLDMRPDIILISCEGESRERVCQTCREVQVADVPVLIVQSEAQISARLDSLLLPQGMGMDTAQSFLQAWVGGFRMRNVRLGAVEVDPDARRLQGPAGRVPLTPTEYQVLEMIVGAEGRLVTRDEILETVWGIRDNSATSHVKHVVWMLRKRLKSAGGTGEELETVRGHGYRVSEGVLALVS